ncbi:MAG: AMP-binding protein [Bacteroidia bacterium]|nr:AMP-binding protein [Bacteroidia bacterium]
MPGSEIFIFDENMEAIGPGEMGEIYIGGQQLSAGYLMRPDLNDELFVTHPLKSNEKLFKTGDKATINEEGTAIYLDRCENLMSIDNVAIDFNRIEWEISKIEGVKQCAVICKDIKGKKRLIAYILPDGDGLDIESLPQKLSEYLPLECMPQKFIAIMEWPYTSHGKLNKHALPIPSCNRHKSYLKRAPSTKLEKELAQIWTQLLNVESLDIDSGFFELGGNHLLADQMVRLLLLKHNYKLDLSTVYRCPSISCLCTEIEKQEQAQRISSEFNLYNQQASELNA